MCRTANSRNPVPQRERMCLATGYMWHSHAGRIALIGFFLSDVDREVHVQSIVYTAHEQPILQRAN